MLSMARTANDFLSGEDGNDILHGGTGDDVLHGLVGRDILYGGAGNDRLVTGTGQNVVTGGSGADVFDFNALDEQTLGTSWITDFKHGVDKIDLFDIDADATIRGNQAFTFIGQDVLAAKLEN
jgi:serralysin